MMYTMKIDLELIRRIAADLAEYREDEETYFDTLDGETDAGDILDELIAQVSIDAAIAAGIDAQIAALRKRKERIAWRSATAKKAIGDVLRAADMKKAERPAATVSVRDGLMSVKIVDADEIPTQLTRKKVTITPDKAAIKKQIEAGEDVPGATLERGDPVVTVRVT